METTYTARTNMRNSSEVVKGGALFRLRVAFALLALCATCTDASVFTAVTTWYAPRGASVASLSGYGYE